MKKIYIIVVIIVSIIFLNWIIVALPEFSKKVFTVTSDTVSSNNASTNGSFAFKSTLEKKELLDAMLIINKNFITSYNEPELTTEKTIENFHRLENFFPDFRYYYSSKQRIENIIFNELSNLYTSTSNMSESELETYFNNNIDYLRKNWGVKDISELKVLVSTIKELNNEKILSYELEDSYFYLPNTGTLNFRIQIYLENSSIIYLGVKIEMYNNNDEYQAAPVIRFHGISGGTSYV